MKDDDVVTIALEGFPLQANLHASRVGSRQLSKVQVELLHTCMQFHFHCWLPSPSERSFEYAFSFSPAWRLADVKWNSRDLDTSGLAQQLHSTELRYLVVGTLVRY